MKKTILLLMCGLLTSVSYSGSNKYGKEITEKKKTKISDILSQPKKFNGKRVLVEGQVSDVCTHQGCWIMISEGKDSEPIRFKVDDGVIVFPVEEKGGRVLAQGVVSAKEYTKEELLKQEKHLAEEAGKAFDPSTVKGPKTVVILKGEGAVISK
jgi:hypothetical protein